MDTATDVLERKRLAFRLDQLVIDCADPELLSQFWAAVLHYEICDSDATTAAIEDPEGLHPSLWFQKVAEGKYAKNRIHFDLDVDEGALEAAVAELRTLGAHEIDLGQGEHHTWVVMADPEGNEFCVVA